MPFKRPPDFVPGIEMLPPSGEKFYFAVHEGKLLVSERFELPFVESLAELALLAESEE